ncbi:MAG: peptidoglycan DD-metalloendopeptidase family protein [Alphaproteobacteria bacterium]
MRYLVMGLVFVFFAAGQLMSFTTQSFAIFSSDAHVFEVSSVYEGGESNDPRAWASLNNVDDGHEIENQIKATQREVAEDVLLPLINDDSNSGIAEVQTSFAEEKVLKIGAGDTISGVLQGAGISGAEAYRAVKAMSAHYDPRKLRPGQAIAIKVQSLDDGRFSLTNLDMKIDPTKALAVYKDEHERYKAELIEKEIVLKLKASKATINSSLYASAARAGIPASLIADMIHLYSYEVDFQRDIRQGDEIEVLYETYETEDGKFARYGNLLYASLNVNKTDIPIYRFEGDGGDAQYYHEDGASLKQLLMKTPVDGARMSSGYGMRKHPILGYSKMHKGMDFAAPRGTPIYAAGDGVIERIGPWGSYGNYMRIRHNGTYKTAYAHMKGYAKGMKKGKRVKQGQVIGYVGNTGRSTGPHLHYEVMKNGQQINPKSVQSTNKEKLAGSRLKKFKSQVADISQRYAMLADDLKYAKNEFSE